MFRLCQELAAPPGSLQSNAVNADTTDSPGFPRLTYRKRDRLTHAREFAAVFNARLKKSAGPLTVHARINEHPHPRLGLSVSRRIGNAAVRTRFKRMIRESFRLSRAAIPSLADRHFDLVVSTRAHDPATLDEYRSWLLAAIAGIARLASTRKPAAGDHA